MFHMVLHNRNRSFILESELSFSCNHDWLMDPCSIKGDILVECTSKRDRGYLLFDYLNRYDSVAG